MFFLLNPLLPCLIFFAFLFLSRPLIPCYLPVVFWFLDSKEEERRWSLIPQVMKGSSLAWEGGGNRLTAMTWSAVSPLVCAHIEDSPVWAQLWYQECSDWTVSIADFQDLHISFECGKLCSFMSNEIFLTAAYNVKGRGVTERKSLNALAVLFLTFSCYITIRKVLKHIIPTNWEQKYKHGSVQCI